MDVVDQNDIKYIIQGYHEAKSNHRGEFLKDILLAINENINSIFYQTFANYTNAVNNKLRDKFLTLIDSFSKYPHAYPVNGSNATEKVDKS